MEKVLLKKIKRICCVLATIVIGTCGFFSCGEKLPEGEVTVYMPDGAPAMAFAQMMLEDTDNDGITYRVVDPSVIASKVTNVDMAKNADICALPAIAASKELGSGEKYQMLGVLTSGNLYVLTNDDGVAAEFATSDLTDLSFLVGKTIGVMKINEVPGMTFKSILNDYDMAWQELTNNNGVAADKVNLKAIVDATQIDPSNKDVACYVVAEPAASVQIKKNGFVSVCSLTELYYHGKVPMNCTEPSYYGYPQAVLVAKKSLIADRADWLKDFIADVEESARIVRSAEKINGEKIVSAVVSHLEDPGYTTTLKAPILTWETIGRCGVGFVENSLCKGATITYLNRILDVKADATKLPSDDFFYMG